MPDENCKAATDSLPFITLALQNREEIMSDLKTRKAIFDPTINIPTLITVGGLFFGAYHWISESAHELDTRVQAVEIKSEATSDSIDDIKHSIEKIELKVDRLRER